MKNAHSSFSVLKVTSSDSLFCLTNSPKSLNEQWYKADESSRPHILKSWNL